MPNPSTKKKPSGAVAAAAAARVAREKRADLIALAGAIAASPAGHTMEPEAIAERAHGLLGALDTSLQLPAEKQADGDQPAQA